MPPPSQLAIATGAVTRLLKEEASYRKELADQEAQVKKLEESIRNGGGDGDGNAEFMLKQNKTAVEQTKAVFGPLKDRIAAAVTKLEDQISLAEEAGGSEDLENAKDVLGRARAKA
ncbi:tubulin folding cofactor A [Metarhizium acridum]|uniref:Tubulin-specific chaperone A n=1 Tax=Metarhizium acridum (strain CQMa 102) TaxID=655827 RepID=E9DZD5_METAQ|nr:tubulin-specific chaperone Rbl2, putative [Metarhizium acridum CQMa 102]EFY90867.1 tubulin-specific chaperone Rbl2, putative [Metarhizium acridum CQMa 102]KAG8421179.1 tubulin folding cofactor A [Metarhizium acridum]